MNLKKIILIATSLLFTLNLSAKEISSSSTLNHYAKPGAAIEMKQTSEKVDVNEFSDVNITLTTNIPSGSLLVEVSLDDKLIPLKGLDKNLSFKINQRNEDFLIHLKVKSNEVGLYYIRLLTKLNAGHGEKLRSFAIPIYVGSVKEITKQKANVQMKAVGYQENISVSKAIETFSVTSEK